jgi:uncharacterized repeat protein (TIGR01451 family)
MQYQTKWVRNMLKLFSFRSSTLMRTFLLAGLVLGGLGAAITTLLLSQSDTNVALANSQHTGNAPSVSIKLFSHIKRSTVTYTLTIRNATHAGIIRKRRSITFSDTIPHGLKNIRAQGKYWDTKVHFKAGLSLVTGTYKGSYPIAPGDILPPVLITGTITHAASNVLIDSASVYVLDNADQAHSNAVVSDNISSMLSSLSLLDSKSKCDNSCNDLSSNDACSSACKDLSKHEICKGCKDLSSDDTCNGECDEQSVHVVVQKSVDISSDESVSDGTYQQNTNDGGDGSNTTPSIPPSPSSNPPSPRSDPPHGRGSAFPTMPNTGSDPQL